MKIRYLLLLFTNFVSILTFSQGFERFFDFDYTDNFAPHIELNNNEFLLNCFSSPSNSSTYYQYIIRVDEDGNIIETLNDSIYRGGMAMQYDFNNFYFTGSKYPDSYLTKTDSAFNIIWQKSKHYDGAYFRNSKSVKLNNNYISYIETNGPYGTSWPQLMRNQIVDTSGQLIYETPFETITTRVTNDSTFYELGKYNWEEEDYRIEIRKLSSKMPFEQDPNFNSFKIPNTWNSSLEIVNDTAYVFYRLRDDSSSIAFAITAADAITGDSLFTKYINLDVKPMIGSKCKTENNDFLILGRVSKNPNLHQEYLVIIRLNSVGELKSIGYIDKFYSITPSNMIVKDGFMYILSTISLDSTLITRTDGYFLKAPIDSLMVSVNQISSKNINTDYFNYFPNPANSQINISLKNISNQQIQIIITDIFGQEVLVNTIYPENSKINIDINKLKSGIYFISLLENGRLLQTEKVVVSH